MAPQCSVEERRAVGHHRCGLQSGERLRHDDQAVDGHDVASIQVPTPDPHTVA